MKKTEKANMVSLAPDLRAKLLRLITNPNVAYIFLMIGGCGVMFVFYSPGMIVPGVIGSICLLLVYCTL